jgi:acetyl esterase/lipase
MSDRPEDSPLEPTWGDVPYGPAERQRIDFYQAEGRSPRPVVVYIHGGGWNALDKARGRPQFPQYLEVGISVAAINYRYARHAREAGVRIACEWPLHDAARAIQFIRSRAAEWNIDKPRFGAFGGSAGGCTTLWLAFHRDMEDPNSDDPVARESTRLCCAAALDGQTTLDPLQVTEWMPAKSGWGAHGFGFWDKETRFAEWLAHRDELVPYIEEYSPAALVGPDAPPVYLNYPKRGLEEMPGEKGWVGHCPWYGVRLKELMDAKGLTCYLQRKDAPNPDFEDHHAFLIHHLRDR